MNSRFKTGMVVCFAVAAVFFTVGRSPAQDTKVGKIAAAPDNASLKKEIQHAVERGLAWLQKSQSPEGFWSQREYPALTGLALTAFMGEPAGQYKNNPPEFIRKGYDYLLGCAKPDGGIYGKDLANYNTSVAMMALVVSYNPTYETVLRKARNYLVGLQDANPESPFEGGVGYGGTYTHSDMSNMVFALEALYYTKFLTTDKGAGDIETKELNWNAAIKFVQRCQNLPGSNDQPWASDDPQNKGGFIYFPGDSKAGEMQLPSGKTALRSYASISYAGLLSYIYADMKKDDPRVKAVHEWISRNYTLEENPGMGAQGLYYCYHTMAKALSAHGTETLKLENGQEVDWRKDLALKLLNLQREDGSWVNDNGRWWEKDPVLVTSYASIILEIIHRGLR